MGHSTQNRPGPEPFLGPIMQTEESESPRDTGTLREPPGGVRASSRCPCTQRTRHCSVDGLKSETAETEADRRRHAAAEDVGGSWEEVKDPELRWDGAEVSTRISGLGDGRSWECWGPTGEAGVRAGSCPGGRSSRPRGDQLTQGGGPEVPPGLGSEHPGGCSGLGRGCGGR